MGTRATKAAGNRYYQARMAAASYDERLKSREGAAELLGIHPSTLSDYELGLTKVMPVDAVMRMAELYNAPELRNYYCRMECPLGADCVPELCDDGLDRTALKILGALARGDEVKDSLLDIVSDGKITPDELPRMEQITDYLDKVSAAAAELKLWVEKHKGKIVHE